MLTLERGSPGNGRSRSADRRHGSPKISQILAGIEGFTTTTEQRQAQVWAEDMLRSLETWRHVQERRKDGHSVEQAARKIAAECGVSLAYGRMAARLLSGGCRG